MDLEKKLKLDKVGVKAYNLSKSVDFTVIAKGFVITFPAYEQLIKNNKKDICYYIKKLIEGKKDINEVSKIIKKIILNLEFKEDLKKEILAHIKKINSPYVVRSSANMEDSKNLSFAGLFDSFLNVTKKDLYENIKKVFASLFNEYVLSYALKNNVDLKKLKMAVIVQEMIDGEKFGTGFSFKKAGNKKTFIIESILKDPQGVTSGKKIPDFYIVKDDKIKKYPSQPDIFHLFPFEIYDLVELMKKSSFIIFPIDIEWTIKEGKLYLLQLRHLTGEIPIPIKLDKKNFAGMPAYLGNAYGQAVVCNFYKHNIKKIKKDKDKILITESIPFKVMKIIRQYAGIITEESGITSHIAILAREYKIPCIVGVSNATKLIKNGDLVRIDGKSGKISLPNKNKTIINKRYIPMLFDIKKIKLFNYKNDIAILYPERERVIVSYGYMGKHDKIKDFYNGRLKWMVNEIEKQYKLPIVNTKADLWGECGLILELSEIDKGIRTSFRESIKLMNPKNLNQIDLEKIKKKINEVTDIGIHLIDKANEQYNKYIKTKNKYQLISGLSLLEKGLAYWYIRLSMLDLQAEPIMTRMNTKQKKEFIRILKESWKYIPDTKSEEITSIMTKIYNTLCLDLVNIEDFSSELAYLNKLKKAVST